MHATRMNLTNVTLIETSLSFIGLPRWCTGKESAYEFKRCKRHKFDPRVGKIPWRRTW